MTTAKMGEKERFFAAVFEVYKQEKARLNVGQFSALFFKESVPKKERCRGRRYSCGGRYLRRAGVSPVSDFLTKK